MDLELQVFPRIQLQAAEPLQTEHTLPGQKVPEDIAPWAAADPGNGMCAVGGWCGVDGEVNPCHMTGFIDLFQYDPNAAEVSGYEFTEWRLVNEISGFCITAISPPIPSPDRTRLLFHMEDITACYIDNGMRYGLLKEIPLHLNSATCLFHGVRSMENGRTTIPFSSKS